MHPFKDTPSQILGLSLALVLVLSVPIVLAQEADPAGDPAAAAPAPNPAAPNPAAPAAVDDTLEAEATSNVWSMRHSRPKN